MPNKQPLPPLKALLYFETAVRYSTFSLAAEELNVTPGAVSRQIAFLESFLETKLFVRRHNSVELSEAGKTYRDLVVPLLAALRHTTDDFHGKQANVVHVYSPFTFTMRWLAPRIPAFYQAFPHYNVSFVSAKPHPSFRNSTADFSIQVGEGKWAGTHAKLVFPIDLIPVCSPALRAEAKLSNVSRLATVSRLHSKVLSDHWDTWLAAAGHPGLEARRQLDFESVSLAYQAAIDGVGVAMGQLFLVKQDLQEARLTALFGPVVRSPRSFYLVRPAATERSHAAKAFEAWILKVADEERRALDRWAASWKLE